MLSAAPLKISVTPKYPTLKHDPLDRKWTCTSATSKSAQKPQQSGLDADKCEFEWWAKDASTCKSSGWNLTNWNCIIKVQIWRSEFLNLEANVLTWDLLHMGTYSLIGCDEPTWKYWETQTNIFLAEWRIEAVRETYYYRVASCCIADFKSWPLVSV